MEIHEIVIPEIPQINVNTYISTPLPVLNVPLPNIDLPGCIKTHRDASVKNTQIIEDDVNGAFYSCPEGKIPSFVPINYDRKKIEIVEQKQESPPSTSDIPKEKETIKLKPCPSKNNQRVGDFRNEKKLERVISHKRGDDGVECITIYEDVPFTSQYIPEVSTIVSTAVIGLVAASSPLLLNIIKPLVKQILMKLTKKKEK